MSCPECGDVMSQKWHRGYSQTLETPAEEAGWECGACGHEYATEDEDRDEREVWGEDEYDTEAG